MLDFHFIALLTYGKESQQGKSSFKIGRGAGADVLLTLFGTHAQETTPAQASYRYVHIDVKGANTHQYYLVLRLTADEKARVEEICRTQGHFVAAYLWQDSRWWQFPCAPQAHYLDPSSYGGTCPKFPPTAAAFLTPSRLTDAVEATVDTGVLTVEQSGTWWWIGGDTYRHREALKAAGAHWSSKRQEWYVVGDALPEQIQALVGTQLSKTHPIPPIENVTDVQPHGEVISDSGSLFTVVKREVPLPAFAATKSVPVASIPATIEAQGQEASQLPETSEEVAQDAREVLMRSVRTDDVTAALVVHIHDSERSKPVLIDFIGSRNAVKQLVSKPFNPAYLGVKAESPAFTIVDGSRYSGFRLPDTSYKAMTTTLSGRVTEGRIVALDATAAAPRTECYVLVMDRIELPRVGVTELVEETWLRYIHYRQTPNRPEFIHYAPPVWASDLYNIYQALRVRIGRPLHERWMPWLFAHIADKPISSEKLGLRSISLCKYIPGFIDPKARGTVECGAYRLTCHDMSDLWAEILIRNPQRADGISFGNAT